jgi:hypothetical protein
MADAIARDVPRGIPPQKGERWKEIRGTRHIRITGAESWLGGLIEYVYLDTKKEGESKLENFVKRFEYDPE